MPIGELARRFSLDAVVLSAGVFDAEKLAWVNRHYLKGAELSRLATLVVPYFNEAGVGMAPDARGLEFLASALTMANASVDRLGQVPGRLAFLFDFSPDRSLKDPGVRAEATSDGARAVVAALADELARAGRLDREQFRAVADRVKVRTTQRGRALFHPIRLALTSRAEGPELDLAVPAIDRGAELPSTAGLPPILGCRERALEFERALQVL
jgi:glutamyl/glutaminyl-tRNA synthetase